MKTTTEPQAIVARRPCGCVSIFALSSMTPERRQEVEAEGYTITAAPDDFNSMKQPECPHGTAQQQLAAIVRNAREGAQKICRVVEETMRVSDTPKSPTTMALEALNALRKIDTIAARISKGEQT